MEHRRIFIGLVAVVVLLLAGHAFWSTVRSGSPTPMPSVVFVGMSNNPPRQMTPTRIEVCKGATGACAMFFVKNVGQHRPIWFDTALVEKKTESGWKAFPTSTNAWGGVGGWLWRPGYGCFYAVGWPPGLPSNAVWRLQVRYGKEPSDFQTFINKRVVGTEIFRSGKEEGWVPSTEVRQ